MRNWSEPLPISALMVYRIPDRSGVYVLLQSERDLSAVLKIASSRSLRDTFRVLTLGSAEVWSVKPQAFLYFESISETAEAARFLAEFRRKRGRYPLYNSGF